MYSSFSPRDRIVIHTSLVGAWAFVALGALGGITLTPVTIISEIGPLALISSWIALVSALVAVIGVLINKYWMEWVAAWFVALGLSVYAIGVWYMVFTTTPSRLQQAAYITALIGFVAVRVAENSAHATKQREIHRITQEILDGDERDV